MEENTYKVYVKTDEAGNILAIDSTAFLTDPTGWVQIDEGTGDRCHHAQGNYIPMPLFTDGGASCYKLENGTVVECTAEEIARQEAALAVTDTDTSSAEALLADMDTAYREGVDSV